MKTQPLSKPILEERLQHVCGNEAVVILSQYVRTATEIAGSEKCLSEVLEGQAFQEKPNCIL